MDLRLYKKIVKYIHNKYTLKILLCSDLFFFLQLIKYFRCTIRMKKTKIINFKSKFGKMDEKVEKKRYI